MASILVADDDHDVLDLVKFALTAIGHEVETVTDGAEAIARFEPGHFDLVCLDFSMPTLDGVAAAEAIHARAPEVPILMLTASATPGDIDRAQNAGVSSHMAKPFRVAELRERVDWLLDDTGSAGDVTR